MDTQKQFPDNEGEANKSWRTDIPDIPESRERENEPEIKGNKEKIRNEMEKQPERLWRHESDVPDASDRHGGEENY